MCGICGILNFNEKEQIDKALLQKMSGAMTHRGPDDEGIYVDNRVGMAMKRLSVIDLISGHQPIHNEDETIWIVCNGEIYNFKQLKDTLIKQGHCFYTGTDVEVIIHLYEQEGENCVEKLQGMFSFCLWDKPKKKFILVRDRLGVKPLYYVLSGERLLFASEIKALLRGGIDDEVNLKAVDYYLSFLYIPAPQTIFKGIKKLLPAHRLTYKAGQIRIEQYWDLSFKEETRIVKNEEYYCENIYSLLKESIKMRLISDVPLGVFLSGGIDSSSIVALMSEIGISPINTFSIGYEGTQEASYNELKFAKAVASYFGTSHHEYVVKPDILKLVPKLIWYLEEPFADSSSILSYIISEIAKRDVTVALSGIGGDELFAGYPRYLGMHLAQYYQKVPLFMRKHIISRLFEKIPESTKSANIPGRMKRFIRGGVLSPVDRYIHWISFFDCRTKEQLYSPYLKERLRENDCTDSHRAYFNKIETAELLNKAFYLDLKTYLPDDLLFMADKMSMANSLEVRVPFCDHKLVEFSASIPYQLKIKGLNPKYLLKKSFKNLLPESILRRKKQGFMVPLGLWFQKELKDYVLDVLSETNIKRRGYFRYDYIRWILNQHYQGKQNFSDHIWALIVLEIWHQIFIDRKIVF